MYRYQELIQTMPVQGTWYAVYYNGDSTTKALAEEVVCWGLTKTRSSCKVTEEEHDPCPGCSYRNRVVGMVMNDLPCVRPLLETSEWRDIRDSGYLRSANEYPTFVCYAKEVTDAIRQRVASAYKEHEAEFRAEMQAEKEARLHVVQEQMEKEEASGEI